jgi:hypothetical protein
MAGFIAGAMVVGSLVSSSASKSAAKTQAASADQAAQLQQQQYEQTREDQMPFLEAGVSALNKLAPLAENYQKFGQAQFEQDPGYAFRLSEGQKALDRSAAARGGLISGSALKAAQRYGQEMGSQEYTNAFNRYQTERSAQLNPLQSLAGVGQTTAAQLGQAGQNMATGAGAAYMGAGNARASGYVGAANAVTGGLQSYLNYNQQQQQNQQTNQFLANMNQNNMAMTNTGGFSNTPSYMVQG